MILVIAVKQAKLVAHLQTTVILRGPIPAVRAVEIAGRVRTAVKMQMAGVCLAGLYAVLEEISIAHRVTAVALEAAVHSLEKPVQVAGVYSVPVTKSAVGRHVCQRLQHVVGLTIVGVARRVAPMGERVVVVLLGPMCAAKITAAAKKGVHVRNRPRKMKVLLIHRGLTLLCIIGCNNSTSCCAEPFGKCCTYTEENDTFCWKPQLDCPSCPNSRYTRRF